MKLLTVARDLKRRKARERTTLFVVEGIRAAEELLRSSIVLKGVLIAPHLGSTERGRALDALIRKSALEVLDVDDRELASAAHTDSPQGVLAIAEIPQWSLADIDVEDGIRLLLVDAIQDPGNAGTLVRTAAAFGVAATIALPGTVDLWSAKVVRSAMGTQFTHPVLHADFGELNDFLGTGDFTVWGADSEGEPVAQGAQIPARLALAVGNEGSGLSPAMRERSDRLVGVPLRAGVESLNVSVAAGILLHELCR